MSKARNLSDLLADGVIGSSEIADGAITEAKIESGAITANKLQTGAAVPSQSGQSGKYLTTDGTTTSWATVDTSQGDTAFSWGDHSVQGYATTTALTTATANSSNWDTAFSWGNHASAGYAPLSNPSFTGTVSATSFSGDGSNLTGIVAGDGSYNGTFKIKANGGYFIGLQMTNLPVGATLVYCFRKVYNNSNQPITVNCRTGGGSPGFSGGSWRELSESTMNAHAPASFNTGGTVYSSMSSGSAGTYAQIQDGAVLFVSLTGTTANVPLYGGTAFTAIVDTFLVDL